MFYPKIFKGEKLRTFMEKRDPSTKTTEISELSKLRERYKDKTIVFTVGCFDILHHGHVYFLNDCSKLGDILVVGIAKDSTMKIYKGERRPINHELNRLFLIAGLESVDHALLNEDMVGEGRGEEYKQTKIDFKKVLEELRPDIFVLGADTVESPNKKKMCEDLGIKVMRVSKDVFEGTKQISTTDIVRIQDEG
jgi:D-beta-D-heptose 7-phosphate kinase / D-beta-D-heptose 1-phosphate adenosyltransferase